MPDARPENTHREALSDPTGDVAGRPGVFALLLIVFTAGYLVMALEILAFRIVQVAFGSAIYATGAVLGVVLVALTLGYWLGGSLSVRFRPTRIQAVCLLCAGLWIFLLAGIPRPLGELLARRENPSSTEEAFVQAPWKTVPEWVLDHPVSESVEFRMRWDPLIASLLLFALPSMLLATVGPCAIRALTRRAEEAGRVAGWIFAMGSLGSIAGVLVTSFWLIALLGLSANLRLAGLVSCVLSAVAVLPVLNPLSK